MNVSKCCRSICWSWYLLAGVSQAEDVGVPSIIVDRFLQINGSVSEEGGIYYLGVLVDSSRVPQVDYLYINKYDAEPPDDLLDDDAGLIEPRVEPVIKQGNEWLKSQFHIVQKPGLQVFESVELSLLGESRALSLGSMPARCIGEAVSDWGVPDFELRVVPREKEYQVSRYSL